LLFDNALCRDDIGLTRIKLIGDESAFDGDAACQ
jgi:hypothetical protein